MKKIVITGALGYIGTELCKLYSGFSWKYEVVAIDNRFISERVNELKRRKIQFIQADILDLEAIKPFLEKAEVVYHLAGITDVAYVKKEADKEKDSLTIKVAIEGTANVLKSMNAKATIVFPSTHVVFEGLKEPKENLDENEQTNTFLAYSSSKVENENQIKNSGNKYAIFRLGSVYGFSTDTMRINIMPNLFSKIASQNGKIKLFGGGVQLKSLVPLIDVARCFKFVEENNDFKSGTYNLTKENLTVKDVADICKKINPKLEITLTDDEVPNKGYSLSNKKLLNTGFEFVHDLETCIKEMITKWSYEKFDKNLEYTFKGVREFIDERGKISNYDLPEPINMIGYIESKKGTMRANHFHPVQEQKCLLIKGQFISIYKDLVDDKSIKVTHVVNEGDMIVTQPNVAHTMVFTEDTIFLNLVRGEREHENYGITHTIPYKFVDDQEKKLLQSIYKFECRCCGSKKLKRVLSLGYQPLANNLLDDIKEKSKVYPLELNVCEECFNCQLSVAIKSNEMFSNYLYQSSTTKSFREHFISAAKKYVKDFKLDIGSYIIDVGSNDGIGLKPFLDLGFSNIQGIEPAKNLVDLANQNGINTFHGYLDEKALNPIKNGADLLLASNVFAHADDLKSMAESMKKLIKPDGKIIIEVQYLLNTIKDLTFDNIYHEHTNYWSLTSLKRFFENLELKIFNVEEIDTHGGSIRIYLSQEKNIEIDNSVNDFLKKEEEYGLKKIETYLDFGKKIENLKKEVIKNLKNLKKKYPNIVGYGAPAKASTALNYFNIKNEIDFIVEDNPLKHGKFIPGVNIPIVSKEKVKDKNSAILVLAWNFFDEIEKNNTNLSNSFINIKSLEKKNEIN
ncbi:NAD-dependent epimerase/dehydratase family protein [Candidatus Pelagibacter sp. Uisw_099_02]|uniref:NAD-dependent epimerase/dehydratase family protein n=1 Tax=Candidatus Pelagibacter sp. Uisw_099_02 TaxID=3230981 RepID=UPI0023742311|nr:NAD-dependent epimerase/dehydratase family protein [Candidatus Pelagibacter sp.]